MKKLKLHAQTEKKQALQRLIAEGSASKMMTILVIILMSYYTMNAQAFAYDSKVEGRVFIADSDNYNTDEDIVFGFNSGGINVGNWVEGIRIKDDTGHVGIGTATPSNDQIWARVLDVHGSNNAKMLVTTNDGGVKTGIFSHNAWDGHSIGAMGTESNHDLVLMAGYENNQVIIKTNGDVGIGNTDPHYKLDLGNNANPSKVLAIHTSGNAQGDFFYGFGNDNRNGIGYLDLYAGGATDNAALSVGHNGNVGIGTISPGTRLHVKGNGNSGTIRITPDNQGAESSVGFYENPDGVSGNSWIVGQNGWGNTGDFTIGWVTSNAGPAGVKFLVQSDGNTGIGTQSPTEKLEVSGNIKADGVILNIGSFPDYVFEEDYPLMPLNKVESYISTHKHLPGFPSEAEVIANGANLGKINNLLVEKVEELTLYTIAQEKLLTAQEKQINKLSDELESIKVQLRQLTKKQ